MNIQQLAAEMKQPVADVQRFVNCLRVWTDKGCTLEEAIAKNEQMMMGLVSTFHNMPTADKKAFVVDTFFPN